MDVVVDVGVPLVVGLGVVVGGTGVLVGFLGFLVGFSVGVLVGTGGI